MKLFIDRFWISPYSFSSFVALKEKNIPFEIVEIALDKREHKQADYSKLSYTGRVPTLVDGDFPIAESSAIAEYLDETYPQGNLLLPKERKDRAQARMIMAWLRSDLPSLRSERATHTMFYKRSSNELSPAARADVERLFALCDRFINDKKFLFGEWSLVDAELSFMIHRLVLNGDHVPDKIKTYATENWSRPSIAEFVQKVRPTYSHY